MISFRITGKKGTFNFLLEKSNVFVKIHILICKFTMCTIKYSYRVYEVSRFGATMKLHFYIDSLKLIIKRNSAMGNFILHFINKSKDI